jgi:hypothetical protein
MEKYRKSEEFWADVLELLLDKPVGTTANITDFAVAFWNGKRLVGVYLRDDGSGILDEDYEFEFAWDNWKTELVAWMQAPRFSERAEVIEWINRGIV